MSKSVVATDYTRIPKAQLIEKLQHLEREVERLAQTGAVETTMRCIPKVLERLPRSEVG